MPWDGRTVYLQTLGLMMPPTGYQRKHAFKAALALRGMTRKQFAESREVTPEHLDAVVRELPGRTSAPLLAAVDAFIADVLGQPPNAIDPAA